VNPIQKISRRNFLGASAMSLTLPAMLYSAKPQRPKVAAVFTSFTHRSHAHVILENFLQPYLFNGHRTDPGVDIVSFYADQSPAGDMTPATSKRFKIPVFKTIEGALCLGGKKLAVDAVLSIGEHGSYPRNALGQMMYPRKRFFDEIVAVMKKSNRFVPMFNDKHLSYRWDWAKEMMTTAKQHGIPMMAGSSVPLAQRRPNLELPAGAAIEEAISIHGGPLESYDFHGLELLQSMVENRKGGETGVSKVEFLDGNAVWRAARAGRWSRDLAEAAMDMELGKNRPSLERIPEGRHHAILLTYKDGMRATVLKIGYSSMRWNFACRLKGNPKIQATSFYVGPWRNRCLFKALSHAIQHHFIHGRAPYPAERTFMVTGILEATMRATRQQAVPLATPDLEFGYAARDYRALREMGASWKIITEKMPEPDGINLHGLKN
jgi:hypothetical protein